MTRMILRAPHKATRDSITHDPIMTGSGGGLDASERGNRGMRRFGGRWLSRIF